ncbi:MAG TPA: histidinol-phosphate transaminase [Acidimicrobiia bacterium]
MPKFREDLDHIKVYRPGKPIEELAREMGITDIIKLASNESPLPPFPEVVAAIAAAAAAGNRYPETTSPRVRQAVAARHDTTPDNVWVAPGGASIIGTVALTVLGPGTSSVYADPSFVMYDIATTIARGEGITVATDAAGRLDLDAMRAAVRGDTTVVFLCNPNNPTSTHLSGESVSDFVASLPAGTLVLVDEAYADFATAPDYASAIPLALSNDDVVVLRTFSKVYGLAGLRIGYAIGTPETLLRLSSAQLPFAVSVVAQAAALEALRHEERLIERVEDNEIGREMLAAELRDRGFEVFESQTNFVAFRHEQSGAIAAALQATGVIIRALGDIVRISVGLPAENERMLAAIDEWRAGGSAG